MASRVYEEYLELNNNKCYIFILIIKIKKYHYFFHLNIYSFSNGGLYDVSL